MLSFFSLFFVFYLVPIILPALVPNKRWFFLYFFIITALTSYILYDLYSVPESERFDGPGGAFGIMLFYALIWAVIAGVVCRALSLITKEYRITLTAIGLVSMPVYIVAEHVRFDWKHRPPSEQCDLSVLKVEIDGHKIELPPAEFVMLQEPFSNKIPVSKRNLNKIHAGFSRNISKRKFCNATSQGKKHLKTGNIVLFLHKVKNNKQICSKENLGFLERRLCSEINSGLSSISQISIFDNSKFDQNPYDQKFGVTSSYDFFLTQNEKYEFTKLESNFYYANHNKALYWVGSPETIITQSGDRLAASCGFYDEHSHSAFSCRFRYKLSHKLYLEYIAQVNRDHSDENVLNYSKHIQNIISDLGIKF